MSNNIYVLKSGGEALIVPADKLAAVHYIEDGGNHILTVYVTDLDQPFVITYATIECVNKALEIFHD